MASIIKFGDASHTDVPVFMDKAFVDYLGLKTSLSKVSDKKDSIEINKDEFIYHIEEVVESLLEKFYFSSLPLNVKSEAYVDEINIVLHKFNDYCLKTKGFSATERYMTVREYLRTIPYYRKFRPNKDVGAGKNIVDSINYYQAIGNEIEDFISSHYSSKRHK